MDSVPCPGCTAPLGLDQEVCGQCRRPRDEREIELGREFVRELARRKARRPLIAVAWAAAAAAAGLLFLFRASLLGRLARWRAGFAEHLTDVENPARRPDRPAQSAGATTVLAAVNLVKTVVSAPPPPSPSSSPSSAPEPSAPPPPESAEALTFPSAPPPPDASGRAFYGVVYDLVTAKPVGGATMDFHFASKPDESFGKIQTDAEGHYHVYLPRNLASQDDVVVAVTAPGYRDGEIEDEDPPYFSLSPKERRRAAAETTESDLDPVPLRYNSDDEIVLLNLVVVPESSLDAK